MKKAVNDTSTKKNTEGTKRHTIAKPVAGIVMLCVGILGIWWGFWAGSLQRGIGLLTRTVAYPELLRFYPYVIGISVILVLCGGVLFVRNLTLPCKKSITCKNCGRILPKGAIFCTVCGKKAGETEENLGGHVISGEETGLGEEETGSGTGETLGEGRESKEKGTSGKDGNSKEEDKVANDN